VIGAGKFQGLQAPLVISSMVESTYEGALEIVGYKNGTYKIVRSTTN